MCSYIDEKSRNSIFRTQIAQNLVIEMSLPFINIAALVRQTRALGPGLRAAVWVQGCPLRCAGCISPDWTEERENQLLSPAELADEIITDNPDIEGITISGGEPFAQAPALAAFLQIVAVRRPELNRVCFSGYTLEALHVIPSAAPLLAQIDTLIDGPYLESLNNGKGLRGSTNQRIHHLSGRLREYDFENSPRQAEMFLQAEELILVGVPPRGLLAAIEQAAGAQL